MGTRPTTDEEHKYLTDLGFSFNQMTAQYLRDSGEWLHFLSANADRKTPQLVYWNAVASREHNATPTDASRIELVVLHSEHFTSPIGCFVTAEVRQWRRPEVS